MRTLIIFPIFIMFLLSIFSVAGNTYYTTPAWGNFTNTTGSSGYGNTYSILPNGTYIFSSNNVTVDIHYLLNSTVMYSFTWDTVSNITNYGWIYFNNGTTGIYVPSSFEFVDWALNHPEETFYQYIQKLAVVQNNAVLLSGNAVFPVDVIAIIAIIAIATVIGITVMSSGISETAQQTILKGTVYMAFWFSLSVVAQPMLVSIYFIGTIFYVGMTFMYIYGFIGSIGFGGANE